MSICLFKKKGGGFGDGDGDGEDVFILEITRFVSDPFLSGICLVILVT